MLLPSYLRRSRHGIYYFRIVLPDPIALVLGQREFVRSLAVRSPKIAKNSGYQIALRVRPLIERLRAVMAIDPNSINPDDVRKFIAKGIDFRPDGGLRIEQLHTSDDPTVSEREVKAIEGAAVAWRRVHDFTANMTDEEFARRKEEAERLKAEMLALCTPAPQVVHAAAAAMPLRPATLREAFDLWMKKKQKIAASTKKAYEGSFELFATLIGGDQRMCHEITQAEFQEFNDALAVVPTHAKKRGIKLKSAAQMLEDPPVWVKNGKAIEVDSISGETANLHLTNLQNFFDDVIAGGRRDGENPFPKLQRHSDSNEAGGAEAFEDAELRAVFAPDNLMQARRPTQFWGPLLALYTGARLNELACLDLVDFVVEKGIPCISIRFVPRAKPGTIQHNTAKRTAKQTKNPTSRRHVPLHPDLWEIGLQDYIEDMRSLGATRLFPTLPADTKGKRERRLSHDGNEYLKRVGVHIPRVKVMHSFRDTVSDMLGLSDMDEFSADQWTGHTTQGVKAKHYRRKVAIDIQATKGFKALDFPFVDTEHIQYRKGWWNEWTSKNLDRDDKAEERRQKREAAKAAKAAP